jgi:hypothetical protein
VSERGAVTTASPLMVVLDSGDEPIPAQCLASYTPTQDDRVVVDRLGSQVVVLGTTGPGAGALVFTDYGLATTFASLGATTPLRTITDPYGAGVGYRVRVTYTCGFVSGAAGVTGRVGVYVPGLARWVQVTAGSGVTVTYLHDMPDGGAVTVQGAIADQSGDLTTYADTAAHALVCEVHPL